MSDAQLSDGLDTVQTQATDRRLPPHPAYFRHRDHNSEFSEHLLVQQGFSLPGSPLDSGLAVQEENDGESNVSSMTHLASSTSVVQGRSLRPAAQSPLHYDNYTELAEEFNGMALNEPSSPNLGVRDGSRDGENYVYQDSLTSSHSQPSASGYEAYAYGTEPSSSKRLNQEDHRHWPLDGYEHSPSSHGQPSRGGFDPFIAAASNVLGGGPPADDSSIYLDDNRTFLPGQVVSQKSFMSENATAAHEGYFSHGSSSSFLNADDEQISNQNSIFLEDPAFTSTDGQDISEQDSSRPSLHRSSTTGSVNLGTRKMKAVDLSAPPYTKEFIDEYRQRIKNDPDPEAHFQYARYLIDAARNIGANAADQRAVRKYRELLVQEALKVIRRLATQGEPYAEAQFFLANCHGTGMLGLQVDHERAYHLYLQAAKQNHSAAAYRVAVCNEIGAGTRREPPRAFAFYRKSASLGDTSAMYKLGMVLLSGGLGQPSNPREAVAWLRRAAEQADEDNPHSLHELGLLHEDPESKIVPCDPLYAKNLFTKAAQLGYTQSQFKLGQCYEYGTLSCSVDPRRSIGWYTRAAEKGDAEAELALSGWYLTGSDGVLKQSDSEAYLWARRAANKGLSTAEYAVGYFSEIGIGVKQDIELAKRWYMRSAAQGNKRSMNRLTELKRMGNKRGLAVRPTRQQAKDECVIC